MLAFAVGGFHWRPIDEGDWRNLPWPSHLHPSLHHGRLRTESALFSPFAGRLFRRAALGELVVRYYFVHRSALSGRAADAGTGSAARVRALLDERAAAVAHHGHGAVRHRLVPGRQIHRARSPYLQFSRPTALLIIQSFRCDAAWARPEAGGPRSEVGSRTAVPSDF